MPFDFLEGFSNSIVSLNSFMGLIVFLFMEKL